MLSKQVMGRGSAENDELSLRIAQPDDVWLHVAGGIPGSHVVVRNPERVDVPRNEGYGVIHPALVPGGDRPPTPESLLDVTR